MSTFPQIVTGITTQLPFAQTDSYSVQRIRQEAGQVYAYYYDSAPLKSWELTFGSITPSELATLRTFWEGRKGGWDTFSFTDPDTSTTYTCRFDGEEFSVVHLGPNQVSLKLRIVEAR